MPLSQRLQVCKQVNGNLCVQVDTMEMMRHPGETTNMRRQTVASYFRVRLSLFSFSFAFVLLKQFLATATRSNLLLGKIPECQIYSHSTFLVIKLLIKLFKLQFTLSAL